MELYFKEIVIEDGYVRFLDRTTQPPFSNDISKLTVSVKDLSNKPSQRATVLTQAVIGGDATLEVRGEMAAIGAPTYINMTTDLNKLAPASANPYVDACDRLDHPARSAHRQARVQDRQGPARR